MNEAKYIQGFNNGYFIAKHEPVLLSKIEPSLTQATPYLEGFCAGKEYSQLEFKLACLVDLQALRELGERESRDFVRDE
jgi:hypothetical protein